jgi:hypothetical protein
LAEKAISSNTVNTISQTVLEEIQTLKDQLKSINIVQDVPPQTDNNYQNQQNQFYQPPQSMPYYVPQRPYYAPQRPQNRVQQNRFHALFKVKDKIILIHKFIDPKGREHGGEQLSSPLAPSEDEDLLLDVPLTGGDVSIISPHMVVSELIPSYLLLTLIISISAFFKRFEFCCFLFFFSVDCFGLESGFGKVDLDDFDDFE